MTRQVAIAAAAVIVAAISVYALRAGPPAPTPPAAATASPTLAAATPTATAAPTPTPTPAATASPTAGPADRYGYVFTVQVERIVVRRERDGAPAFELAGIYPAVSPDGRRLAYWRTTAEVGATDLRVLDVADPATDRSVFAVPADSVGGGVVWSNDGQGLLFVTSSRERTTGGFESCPKTISLLMLDLAPAPAAPRLAGSGGCALIPVAWDRPEQIAAAVVTGPGGFATEYMTWDVKAATPAARTPFPRPSGEPDQSTLVIAERVYASPDAKLVMGVELSLSVLRVWPILDLAKAERIRSAARFSLPPVWRPGATAPYEVIWAPGPKVDLFRYRTDQSTTLYTSDAQGVGIAAVRPDGSGVLISESAAGPPAPPTYRFSVVEIATRRTTEVAALSMFGTVLPRGVLFR